MMRPRAAMVLAAGRKTRMRALTQRTAKPLLFRGGSTLLDHFAVRYPAAEPRIELQIETAFLDTGGAVRAAPPLPGRVPLDILNGDKFWLGDLLSTLARCAPAFISGVNAERLVQRIFQVQGSPDTVDSAVDPAGRGRRCRLAGIMPRLYAGTQLAASALFTASPDGAFSLNSVRDQAITAGQRAAVVRDSLWYPLSPLSDLARTKTSPRARVAGKAR